MSLKPQTLLIRDVFLTGQIVLWWFTLFFPLQGSLSHSLTHAFSGTAELEGMLFIPCLGSLWSHHRGKFHPFLFLVNFYSNFQIHFKRYLMKLPWYPQTGIVIPFHNSILCIALSMFSHFVVLLLEVSQVSALGFFWCLLFPSCIHSLGNLTWFHIFLYYLHADDSQNYLQFDISIE